uniref:Uncharacterized protein n=1 Tax=Melopsittacus undulatus TaxID=13146 RepID=A0A8V5GTG5_MELUD
MLNLCLKQNPLTVPFFLCTFGTLVLPTMAGNPHEPMVWKIYNLQETHAIQNITTPKTVKFIVPLTAMIIGGHKDKADTCRAYYVCPASNPGKSYCNQPGQYFCGYWGCETWASDWTSPGDRYLKFEWEPEGIEVKNPTEDLWLGGKIWGIRFWDTGPDRGSMFKIVKERLPHDPLSIGPNLVLNPPTSSEEKVAPVIVVTPSPDSLSETTNNTVTEFSSVTEFSLSRDLGLSESKDPLWNLMQASYRALNESKPNLTEECWLCYNVRPPYFEAIGKPGRIQWSNSSNPRELTGQGKCIGTVPKKYQPLCNRTVTIETIERHKNRKDKWAIPTPGAKWVCSDIGVTPCLSLHVFNQSQFCIQVIIVPRLIYHTSEEVLRHFEGDLNRQKQEPITVVTLATLLIAGGVGAGTGIASLVKGQELQSLQMAVDEDLAKIEQSIQNLAASVKTFSEVVLQNRRGLDLLFLKEGGLCVALSEECCTFADHTGVVQNTMSELRKRLDQRKKDHEAGRSWYENWFNVSPWLTTLLSALAGPLIMLIWGLIFGPCILRYVLHFIRERFDIAKLLILTTRSGAKYKSVSINEDEDCCECVMPHESYAYCNCEVLACECYDKCWDCGKRFARSAENESSV